MRRDIYREFYDLFIFCWLNFSFYLIGRYAATGSCNIFVFIVTWVFLDTNEASTSSNKLGSADASAFTVSRFCSLVLFLTRNIPPSKLLLSIMHGAHSKQSSQPSVTIHVFSRSELVTPKVTVQNDAPAQTRHNSVLMTIRKSDSRRIKDSLRPYWPGATDYF